MIVVLDTSVWLGELGLNSSLGAAVRFFLQQRSAQLALPEVVRLEVERNFREKLTKLALTIQQNHRQLLAVFGRLKEVVLPDEREIEAKVAEIFSGVGVELVPVPLSLESARSSFLKTIDKLPPSDRDQQFKDGVLWADCLGLLRRDEVRFVTSDTAFFQRRKYEEGLARNLADEAAGLPHTIRVFHSLSELLADLRTEVSIDDNLLVRSFLDHNRKLIDQMLERHRFRLEDRSMVRKSLYATEDSSVLYVKFSIDVPCADISDQGRKDAVLHLEGDGSYNIGTRAYADMHISKQELDFFLADGTKGQSQNIILGVGSIVLGHKDVVHRVRYDLTEEDR